MNSLRLLEYLSGRDWWTAERLRLASGELEQTVQMALLRATRHGDLERVPYATGGHPGYHYRLTQHSENRLRFLHRRGYLGLASGQGRRASGRAS